MATAAVLVPSNVLWSGYFFYLHVVRKDMLAAGLLLPSEAPLVLKAVCALTTVHPEHAAAPQALVWPLLLELVGGVSMALHRTPVPLSGRSSFAERLHMLTPPTGGHARDAHSLLVRFYFLWFRGLVRTHELSRGASLKAGKKSRFGPKVGFLVGSPLLGSAWHNDGDEDEENLIGLSGGFRTEYLRHRAPVLVVSRGGAVSLRWPDLGFVACFPLLLTRRCAPAPLHVQLSLASRGRQAPSWRARAFLSGFRLGQRLRAAKVTASRKKAVRRARSVLLRRV